MVAEDGKEEKVEGARDFKSCYFFFFLLSRLCTETSNDVGNNKQKFMKMIPVKYKKGKVVPFA
jgi:hypothetical protein